MRLLSTNANGISKKNRDVTEAGKKPPQADWRQQTLPSQLKEDKSENKERYMTVELQQINQGQSRLDGEL